MHHSRNVSAEMAILAIAAAALAACSRNTPAQTGEPPAFSVGVTPIRRMPLEHRLTLSSELVPFQEIDVYAKESGFVQKLLWTTALV